ncbi:MOSC domain-containing protein [Bacillus pacificus]
MREEDVCIGDTFELGQAIVQVTQPRQPCFKLAKNVTFQSYHYIFKETGYTGFYFRVLKEGWRYHSVDTLKRLQSDPKGVSIAFANCIMHKENKILKG